MLAIFVAGVLVIAVACSEKANPIVIRINDSDGDQISDVSLELKVIRMDNHVLETDKGQLSRGGSYLPDVYCELNGKLQMFIGAINEAKIGDVICIPGEDTFGTNSCNKDTDDDYIDDALEIFKYRTNPLTIDTDGDGIDDFNETFTYGHILSPHNPEDADKLMRALESIKADEGRLKEAWNAMYFHSKDQTGVGPMYTISKRDPRVCHFAKRIRIELEDGNSYAGRIRMDSKQLTASTWLVPPIPAHVLNNPYSLSPCFIETARYLYIMLKLGGYDVSLIEKEKEAWNGAWVEARLDGKEYVIFYDRVYLKDEWLSYHYYIYFPEGTP